MVCEPDVGLPDLTVDQVLRGFDPRHPPIEIARIAQLARAPAFQAGGCGFESHFSL